MLTPRRSNRLAGLEPDVHPRLYYNINTGVPTTESGEDPIPEAGDTLETCAEVTMVFTAFVIFMWLMLGSAPPTTHFYAI